MRAAQCACIRFLSDFFVHKPCSAARTAVNVSFSTYLRIPLLCSANARLAYADSHWRTADGRLKPSALPIAGVDIFAK